MSEVTTPQRDGREVSPPPHWLVQLLRLKQAPIPWKRAARAAAAIAGPIAVGLLVGRLDLGVLVSIGALCATIADTDGTYRARAQRIGWAVTGGAAGFFLGSLAAGHGWWTACVVVGLAALSALISASGAVASLAGLQMLVFGIVGSGQARDVLVSTACFVVGAVAAAALALAAWPVRATVPERVAVAEIFERLGAMLAASGTVRARQARTELTEALNRAYDALLTTRSRVAGRDEAYRRLMTLLSETTPVIEASVALVNAGRLPPASVIVYLISLAEAVRSDQPFPEVPEFDEETRALAALRAGLEGLDDVHADRSHDPRKLEDRTLLHRFTGWWDTISGGPVVWVHVLRLVICMALAEWLGAALRLEYPYWVSLTVAIVLKPDFGSVFGRAVLRGAGTVLGVLIGAAVLATAPPGWVLVLLIVLIAATVPIAKDRNYGMFSTFVTPLVIVQLDLAHTGDWRLVLARLADTLLGCAIVLVAGYLLWPASHRHPPVAEKLVASLEALAKYTERALQGVPQGRAHLRRQTYRSLSDLRSVFQQAIVEPSASGRRAAAWWPTIVALERAADAVTGLAVAVERGAEPVEPDAVEALTDAVREAACSVRERRPPRRMPMPDVDRLARLVAELRTVYTALRGPDLDARSAGQIVRRLLRPVRRA